MPLTSNENDERSREERRILRELMREEAVRQAKREARTAEREAIRKRRLAVRSRVNYKGGLNKFRDWLIEFEPQEVQDGEIILPIAPSVFLDFIVDNKYKKNGELMSFSTLSGYRSALANLHKEKKIDQSKDFQSQVSEFFAGLKRTHQDQKDSGERKAKEGKAALSFRGYRATAMAALKHSQGGYIFMHVFVLLAWNLISRCNNITNLHLAHLSWSEDAMTVQIIGVALCYESTVQHNCCKKGGTGPPCLESNYREYCRRGIQTRHIRA